MKWHRGKENLITDAKLEYDLVPRLAASRSNNKYPPPAFTYSHFQQSDKPLAVQCPHMLIIHTVLSLEDVAWSRRVVAP